MSEFRFTIAPPLSLYVHLPWCVRKCPYCDFNSFALRGSLPEDEYLEALLNDLGSELQRIYRRTVTSVFFGGGTPSLFSPETINRLLSELKARAVLASNAEITLEANPGAVDQRKFARFLDAGVNRLSVGVQSFNDAMLSAIRRIHSASDARRAVQAARNAGFENINIDLMYGLPGQTLGLCQADLIAALDLAPQHISYYQLTIEPNTLFHAQPPSLPDGDMLWDMHVMGNHILRNHGYTQYEVSAYSRQGLRCRHNMNYWQFGDYLGVGAGAHGKLTSVERGEIIRTCKVRQPWRYIASVRETAKCGRRLVAADAVFEFMLNALRLREGVPASLFAERTGMPIGTIERQRSLAVNLGLLAADELRLFPTELGRRFLNDLIMLFLRESVS